MSQVKDVVKACARFFFYRLSVTGAFSAEDSITYFRGRMQWRSDIFYKCGGYISRKTSVISRVNKTILTPHNSGVRMAQKRAARRYFRRKNEKTLD
ncbi:MAG: hypothetical protein II776_05535, partial [Clostridia bacterium]|nr:hypothetical protein [Clostridia bacterium]